MGVVALHWKPQRPSADLRACHPTIRLLNFYGNANQAGFADFAAALILFGEPVGAESLAVIGSAGSR
jgi:hypothetical protein